MAIAECSDMECSSHNLCWAWLLGVPGRYNTRTSLAAVQNPAALPNYSASVHALRRPRPPQLPWYPLTHYPQSHVSGETSFSKHFRTWSIVGWWNSTQHQVYLCKSLEEDPVISWLACPLQLGVNSIQFQLMLRNFSMDFCSYCGTACGTSKSHCKIF